MVVAQFADGRVPADHEDAADTIGVDKEIVAITAPTGRRVRNRIPSPRVLLR
jgi:hypothetical protein